MIRVVSPSIIKDSRAGPTDRKETTVWSKGKPPREDKEMASRSASTLAEPWVKSMLKGLTLPAEIPRRSIDLLPNKNI
jgi:hypothetical protein